MLLKLVSILLLTWSVDLVSCDNVEDIVRRGLQEQEQRDVGTRLILTPYIESGNIEEARNLSRVSGGPFPEDIPSYSGFFTVNETYDSNLFFWFFPSEVSFTIYCMYVSGGSFPEVSSQSTRLMTPTCSSGHSHLLSH